MTEQNVIKYDLCSERIYSPIKGFLFNMQILMAGLPFPFRKYITFKIIKIKKIHFQTLML